jgi:DNA-binding NarL/FixJ family response regulator
MMFRRDLKFVIDGSKAMNEQNGAKESGKIRVLIVDDHPIMRVGIAAIVEATPDMTTVAQAGSGEEAVELFEKHLPDITLMDLRLPGISGVEAIRILMARHPNARFVVLTTYEGDEDIHQALAAGARSYIIKGMPHEALVSALRRVHAGGRFLPPPVSRALNSRIPNSDLSTREREVLDLIVRGKSNKEIAVELGITESTVKCHVSVILMRLNVTDRTQAVVSALQRGLVHL